MMEILIPILSLSAITFVLGLAILWASKKFHVTRDPLIDTLTAMLPGVNCGACGYPGCGQFAENLVKTRDPSKTCPVGGSELGYELGRILGIKLDESKPLVCVALCNGSEKTTKFLAEYKGIRDCWAAMQILPGLKQCAYGCVGLGSCVPACKYGALKIEGGLIHVDGKLCIGCGLCIVKCPQVVLKMTEKREKKFLITCQSKDKAPATRKYCSNGCIACGLCVKACKHGAIKVENFCAVIDDAKCVSCGDCVPACRMVKCIHMTEYDIKAAPPKAADKAAGKAGHCGACGAGSADPSGH
jgi:electron transport complex protein RnfB